MVYMPLDPDPTCFLFSDFTGTSACAVNCHMLLHAQLADALVSTNATLQRRIRSKLGQQTLVALQRLLHRPDWHQEVQTIKGHIRAQRPDVLRITPQESFTVRPHAGQVHF